MLTLREQVVLAVALGVVMVGGLWSAYSTAQEGWTDWEEAGSQVEASPDNDPELILVVHVTGQVKSPGVYQLESGQRIIDAINAAGGFASEGDPQALNLAAQVSDGQRIWVPGIQEESQEAPSVEQGERHTRGVSVNRASWTELQSIPGIGPALAQRIIDYRREHGFYSRPEDLLGVRGIGEKTLSRILPHIRLD